MPTKKPGTRRLSTTYSMLGDGSKSSKPTDPLSELTNLLEEDWEEEDSRVSVTVVAAATPAPRASNESIPPKSLKKVATIVTALVILLASIWTGLKEAGVLQ